MTHTPFESLAEYEEALDLAQRAAVAYYEGQGEISIDDSTYDLLVRRIEATEAANPTWARSGITTQVAGGVSIGGDVEHSQPMLSLDNALDEQEFASWYERLARICELQDISLVVEPKLDGVALAVRYENGTLVQIITRGDGRTGEDVTTRVQGAKGMPQQLPEPLTIEVRGECVLTKEDFEIVNERRVAEGKPAHPNPRNAVAGAVRRIHGTWRAPLTFAAYAVVGEEGTMHSVAMSKLTDLGFTTASGLAFGAVQLAEGLEAACAVISTLESKRADLDFDIDGAVVKVDDPQFRQKAGMTSKAPRWAIARKYPPDTKITKLLEIKLQLGRTGAVTPVGVLEPVFVGGTTITYVTLHNAAEIARKDLRPGDSVVVRRAGEVIPEIVGRFGEHEESSTAWVMPGSCPSCGEDLDRSQVVARCETPSCGLARAIEYFASRDCMDIEGLGETLVNQLIDQGLVSSPADLYTLTAAQLAGLERMGDTSAAKVIENIAGSKSQPLNRLFCALGIRYTGRTMSRRIAAHFKTLEAIRSASVEEMASVEGMGAIKAPAVVAQIARHGKLLDELVALGLNTGQDSTAAVSASPLAGKKVVVSGSVPGLTRTEAQEWVERLGGSASGSVSKNTDLLVAGEGAGSKLTLAEKHGVPVMSADDFAALVRAHR